MVKNAIIFIVICIILLFVVKRCGSETSTPQSSLDNATNNIDSAAGKLGSKISALTDSAKDTVGNSAGRVGSAIGDLANTTKNVAENSLDKAGDAGAALGDLAVTAKDAAGNVLNSTKNSVANVASTVGNMADSSQETAIKAAGDIAKDQQNTYQTDSNTRDLTLSEGAKVTLKSVTFKFNSSELNRSSFSELDVIAKKLKGIDNQIEIAGHTDNVGNNGINIAISQKRAESVLQYLVSKGIDADRLSKKGYGAEHPIADNTTEVGRTANRRVDIHIK